jgi:hypothetical protein
MQNQPPVEMPLALFEPVHVSGIQMDFANESFGFPGEAFVSQIGTDAPIARPPPTGTIIGQNVVRVNTDNKTISDFLSLNNSTTEFRPTDPLFSQNGTALYIVDWGNVSFTTSGPVTSPNSGVVWKITPTAARNQ